MKVFSNAHVMFVRTEPRVLQVLVKHTVDESICDTHCRRKLEDNRGLRREWWKRLAQNMVYWQVLIVVLHPDCKLLTS
jgi:hypothetical protein